MFKYFMHLNQGLLGPRCIWYNVFGSKYLKIVLSIYRNLSKIQVADLATLFENTKIHRKCVFLSNILEYAFIWTQVRLTIVLDVRLMFAVYLNLACLLKISWVFHTVGSLLRALSSDVSNHNAWSRTLWVHLTVGRCILLSVCHLLNPVTRKFSNTLHLLPPFPCSFSQGRTGYWSTSGPAEKP